MSRSNLRKKILACRRAMNEQQQAEAAVALLQNIKTIPAIQRVSVTQSPESPTKKNCLVGAYLAVGGEISLSPTLSWLQSIGVSTAVPVIRQKGEYGILRFSPITDTTSLRPGRFNIQEPDIPEDELMDASDLDIVLVPLVSFDEQGNRLGMGGGYYDRTFSFRQGRNNTNQLFAGVAHEVQKSEQIPIESWDIPLDMVVTDNRIYNPSKHTSVQ